VIIYGVWAVIPVGMLLIVISAQIILFGLELAYVLQFPHLYRPEADIARRQERSEYHFWNATFLTSLVYKYMYSVNRPLNNKAALAFFDGDARALETARKRLENRGFFSYDPSLEEYLPIKPPSEIKISELQRIVLKESLSIPPDVRGGAYRARFGEVQRKLLDRMEKGLSALSIADLLPLMGKIKTR